MKRKLSTIAVLALIAVPISACGSTADRAPEQRIPVADQSEKRVYESDLVSEALTGTGNRVYESDLVSDALAATR